MVEIEDFEEEEQQQQQQQKQKQQQESEPATVRASPSEAAAPGGPAAASAPADAAAAGSALSPAAELRSEGVAVARREEGAASAVQSGEGDAGERKGGAGGDQRSQLPKEDHAAGKGQAAGEEGGEPREPKEAPADEETFEDALTEEEQLKRAIEEADAAKADGNKLYAKKEYEGALQSYAKALQLAPDHADSLETRAACHANSAACHLQLTDYEKAVKACTAALDLKSGYVKALSRRAQAQEKLDHLDEALEDHKKILELDRGNKAAMADARRLEPIVAERREKMKEEMLGKLKELGDSLLGHFGLSTDNFKAEKDPSTGSYSINFRQ